MKNSYFLSQPHQPFFILAFINAIVLMVIFMLSFKGVLNLTIYPAIFHSYSLIYLFFTPAFFGFLFTTFPKFLSVKTIHKNEYIPIVLLYYIGTILYVIGSFYSNFIYNLSLLVIFIAFFLSLKILYSLHKNSTINTKHDTFWILIALFFGLLAQLIFIFLNIGYEFLFVGFIQISVYLYLFLLVFSVAQRMIPFFSHCNKDKNTNLLKYIFILLALHISSEIVYSGSSFFIDIIISIIITKELLRWKLPFPNTNAMIWILHLGLFWIPIAFITNAISNILFLLYNIHTFYIGMHILLLGFIFTTLIGFGTRVTLGHSGNIMQSTKLITFIFYLTQIVVLIRIIVSIVASFEINFMIIFDISVTIWLLTILLWMYHLVAVLVYGKKLKS